MCHNSYYKDIEGDRAAGVRTLQTCFDKRVSLLVAIIVYMLYVGISTYMAFLAPDGGGRFSASHVFLPAAGIAITLALMGGHLCCIVKKQYHRATRLNCQLCVAMVYALLLQYSAWMPVLEILSLAMIRIMFIWYDDENE